jgi:hypothetical protein
MPKKEPDEERIVRKTYSLTNDDLQLIESLKKRYLIKQMSILDSHIIRAGLIALNMQNDKALIKIAQNLSKPHIGRRKAQA